jgi:peroxiredoxin
MKPELFDIRQLAITADARSPDLPLADGFDPRSGSLVSRLTEEFWRQCLALGEVAPDFVLPNGAGEPVSLDSLLDAGPVVVIFEHGNACALCAAERRVLDDAAAVLNAAGAGLVVISADCRVAADARPGPGHVWYEVLWDCDGKVAHLYGLVCRASSRLADALRDTGVVIPDADGATGTLLGVRAHYVIETGGLVTYAAIELGHDRPLDIEALAVALTSQPTWGE